MSKQTNTRACLFAVYRRGAAGHMGGTGSDPIKKKASVFLLFCVAFCFLFIETFRLQPGCFEFNQHPATSETRRVSSRDAFILQACKSGSN